MKFLGAEKLSYKHTLKFNPGPGYYDFPSAFATEKPTTKTRKQAPKSAAFNQGSNRFPTSTKNEIDVGPGYYFGQSEWQIKRSKKDPKAQFYPNPRKIITIPSIPSSTHAMGYVEREDGYLIPLNGTVMKEEHDLGPGAYHAKDDITHKKVLGFDLGRVKSTRFPMQKADNHNDVITYLKPETYDLPKKEITEKEIPKRKETSQPPAKVKIDDDEPGLCPGHYYNERLASSFNVQTKPKEFQFFGTTAKRFITPSDEKVMPGPGFYDPLNSENVKDPYVKVEPFAKGDRRFKGSGMEDLPGPGAYNADGSVSTKATTAPTPTGGFIPAFGSSLNRFVSPSSTKNTPGPGSYNSFKVSKKNKKRKMKPVLVAPVHTIHPENGYGYSKETPLGADLDFGGRSKGAVVVRHDVPANKGTFVFQSVNERFKSDKTDEGASEIGPGTYFADSNRSTGKQTFNSFKTTFAKTPRDHQLHGEKYKQMLGPGIYDYEVDIIKQKINYVPKINPKPINLDILLPK